MDVDAAFQQLKHAIERADELSGDANTRAPYNSWAATRFTQAREAADAAVEQAFADWMRARGRQPTGDG